MLPTRRHLSALLVATIGLVGACVEALDGTDGPVPRDTSAPPGLCEEVWSPACDHPLDRAIIGLWRAAGLDGEALQTTPELCRRMAIDLIGRPLTPDEAAECAPLGPDAAARLWLTHPEHPLAERRHWAGVLGYDVSASVYWRQIDDLDRLVDALARGDLRYDDFAAQVVTHPAFAGLHRDDAWAEALFGVFLGRPPRPDEVSGLRPISAIFQARQIVDGRFREWVRADCLARGGEAERCQQDAEMFRYAEYAVNTCACRQSFGCVSTALGGLIDLGEVGCTPTDVWQDGLRGLIAPSAGQSARCRDGSSACADAETRWDPEAQADYLIPATPLQPADEALRATLGTIGARLTARGDFLEAAVDRELRRLLGWWQDAFRVPDADLPAVRAFLAEVLAETGSLAEVRRLIVTSRLYAAPVARAGQPVDAPPWASARLKFLAGERWLAAVSAAVGETVAPCDHRLLGRQDWDVYWHHAAARALLDDFELPAQSLDPDYFDPQWPIAILDGFRVGACRAGGAPTAPNLSIIQAQSGISQALCATGRGVVPPAAGAALTPESAAIITEHLFARALGRSPEPDERDAIGEELDLCVSGGACQSPEQAARWLCARLLDSTLFTLY